MTKRRLRRKWARCLAFSFGLGILGALLAARMIPPAPPFSPEIGRATFWQSYEWSYFASLRSYDELIRKLLESGDIPVIVLGDSTMRGTGAGGNDAWTRILEKRLQVHNPRVRVVNYAQNSGHWMGFLLFHHLQQKFPAAYYIVQWHFGARPTSRTPSLYGLTSEIALRDGRKNPAVRLAFDDAPIAAQEWPSFFMAGLNIATNYLDVGNWIRYRWLGDVTSHRSSIRKLFPNLKIGFAPALRKLRLPIITITSLQSAPEKDVSIASFAPPDEAMQSTLRNLFSTALANDKTFIEQPLEMREQLLSELFPAAVRDHLLVVTIDRNPYYAPRDSVVEMDTWDTNWKRLRQDMSGLSGLNWFSLTGSAGELKAEDYVDLAHLNSAGQKKLGNAVADDLLASADWFKPKTSKPTR